MRRTNKAIERARAHFGSRLQEIPEIDWPFVAVEFTARPLRVWCSRMFTAQLFDDGGRERLSISVARVNERGGFQDGLTWDELQQLKCEAGFGERWAIEVYPPDSRIVNVSNIRHLWLLDSTPAVGWNLSE